jgi:hypothetical protein
VTVERLSRHLYLAEYERTIIIEKGGRPIMQLKIFPDTGGYSRANLYRLDGHTLLLRDAADSYTIDLVNQAVSRTSRGEKRDISWFLRHRWFKDVEIFARWRKARDANRVLWRLAPGFKEPSTCFDL